MMKRFFIILSIVLFALPVFANETRLVQQEIQNRINNCALKIVNSNRISNPIIFEYSYEDKKREIFDKTIFKRRVIVYDDIYKSIQNNDELASFLARQIVLANRSYDGLMSGKLRSLQMKAAPKKFEIVADKIAVDYMVKADYDPIALIVYLKRTAPEKKFDLISTTNLTSKRLAAVYNYIYVKYPYYLVNSEYLNNPYYKNFLANFDEKTVDDMDLEKPITIYDNINPNSPKVPIHLQIKNEITTEKDLYEGQILEFKVAQNVEHNEEILLKKGEIVTCKVETIIKNGMNGIPASVILGDFKIPNLESERLNQSYEKFGRDLSLLVFPLKWALTILPPTGSLTNFIKGGHVKITPESLITIYYYPEIDN